MDNHENDALYHKMFCDFTQKKPHNFKKSYLGGKWLKSWLCFVP